MSARPEVLIVGAGVTGLTTAMRLVESGFRVRIRAESAPWASTSASAGAIWDPIYAVHPRMEVWASRTYTEFARMAGDGEPGVHLVDGVEAAREPIRVPDWATRLPDYRECATSDLPPGFASGWHYRAPIIDMPTYLEALQHRLREASVEMAYGTRMQTLKEVLDEADVVVNCSGIGARHLVPDETVVPVRGQLVVVRNNSGLRSFFAEHTAELDEMTYVLPQGDVLLLGGSAEKGKDEPVPDTAVARAIVERCALIFPAIQDAEVLGHRAGIRPSRPEVRVERDEVGGRPVVHNYGHSGAGVSLSWGCADDVAALVGAILG